MNSSTQHFKEINALLYRGHYDQALKKIEGLLQSSTDTWMIFHYAGLSCFGLEQFREAKGFFEKALKVSPNRHASLVGIASCHIHLGRLADGLFYHKLSLATTSETDPNLLSPMIDFASNLALWRENINLLKAINKEREGQLIIAQKLFLDHAQTKDPSPEVLHFIAHLSLKIGAYSEALNASIAYHHFAPHKNSLLAAKVLHRLGKTSERDALLEVCLEDSDHRTQAGALNIIAQDNSMPYEQQADFIAQCWTTAKQNTPFSSAPSRAKASDHYSVGIFLGDLSLHSTALWFFDSLRYFDDSNVNIVVYLENADYWGRNFFRLYQYETIETELIDAETLAYIVARNDHQVLLNLSDFDETFRLDVFSQFSNTLCVGLADHPAHLKQGKRSGYDAILVQNSAPSAPNCYPISEIAFFPEAVGQQWQARENEEFCITFALLPKDVPRLLPLLVELLQLNQNIVLSLNETLCGEYGLDLLVSGFEKLGVDYLLDRVSLFQQSDFRDHNDIAEHLLSGDLLLSTGMVGYDYTALQRRVPLVLISDQHHPVLSCFVQPNLTSALKTWLEDPEQWAEWVMNYQQQCDEHSSAPEHFDAMQNFMNIMFS